MSLEKNIHTSPVNLRKIQKPIIEKRRRDRINKSLDQLKDLVLNGLAKNPAHYTKLEKADVLEMTVKYIKSLQNNNNKSTDYSNIKFSDGFVHCATYVSSFLSSTTLNESFKQKVLQHLNIYLKRLQGTQSRENFNLRAQRMSRESSCSPVSEYSISSSENCPWRPWCD